MNTEMTNPEPTRMTNPEPGEHNGAAPPPVQRRGPDLITLAAGLVALSVAGSALLGGLDWLPSVDARWGLATVAILVGLLLVIGSLRPRRH